MGFSATGWQRRWLWPIFWLPAHLFASFAADFDRRVAAEGLVATASHYLPRFVEGVEAHGLEQIPSEGPLLVVSNHPGTFDGFAILSNLPRDDLKIIASGVPFTQKIPATRRYLIYSTSATEVRMNAVRQAIRHLAGGGMLLIFPSGRVDPDPALLSGAREALRLWSHSISFLPRKIPQTRVLVTIASGVLAPQVLNHPLTKLRKPGWERQRLAEYVQIMGQLIFRRTYGLTPRITFGNPIQFEGTSISDDQEAMMEQILEEAERLLVFHERATGEDLAES